MIHKIKSMMEKKIRALQNTDKIILIVTEIQMRKIVLCSKLERLFKAIMNLICFCQRE